MKILSLFAVIVALIIGLAIAAPISQSVEDWNSYNRGKNELDLLRRQDALDQQRRWEQDTYAGRLAQDYTFRVLAFVAFVGLLVVIGDAYNKRQARVTEDRRLILPDDRGMLPVTRHQLEADDLAVLVERAIEAYHAKQIEEARRPLPPHTLTYAPKFSNTTNGAEPAATIAAPLVVPSFAQLLAEGKIGPDATGRLQPLILGYGAEGALTGDWRRLYSAGLGGLQGSGKTWGATFLLAQSALSRGKLIICDNHAGDDESLAHRVEALSSSFLCDIADDDKSILVALKLASDILERRKHGDKDRTPVIVAIDEWLSLRRGPLADVLPAFVESISTEGRKLNIHALLMTQRADKDAIGDFRNTLASSYVFRLRADEARMLTGLRASALPDDTLQLAPGEAYLLDTAGALTRVRIPLMTGGDVATVGRLLTDDQPKMPADSVTIQSKISQAAAVDYSAVGRGETRSPEAQRVISLFLAGKDASAIVSEVHGLSSRAGAPYMRKLADVQEVIRAALRAA